MSAYSREEPIIQELSFVLPVRVRAMSMTVTAKGITGKQLLLATGAGELVAIPRSYL